ncbi:MAG: GTP cyclohydrolase II [Candidatus Anstonellaceae archaeon]
MKKIKFIAKAFFPTIFGNFELYCFEDREKNAHFAIVRGNIKNKKNVICRIHSKCLTGDALGSIRCDCREQYERAMEYIAKQKAGIMLYLEQEGRGIGIKNKIKAYWLQDRGYDTVEANLKLGFKADERDYEVGAQILKYFKVKSIQLITNNPKKILELEKFGIKVTKRIELPVKGSVYSKKYLKTKKEKLGHLITDEQN